MRKRILPFIMVMLMIFTALPISASASTLYYGKTINSAKHTQILHLKCGAGRGMKPSQTMGQLIFQMALHLVIRQAL